MLIKCARPECDNTFFYIAPMRGAKRKYCDKRCGNLVKAANYLAKHGKEKIKQDRTTHLITCGFCKKQVLRDISTRKFCNNKCAIESKKKFLDIPDCLESASRKLDKNLGYVRVYVPMHPEANTWGYVYEHRVIAEQIIGRRLEKGEIVHHKNGKRWDNRPENLEVMTHEEHGKLHGQRPEDLKI